MHTYVCIRKYTLRGVNVWMCVRVCIVRTCAEVEGHNIHTYVRDALYATRKRRDLSWRILVDVRVKTATSVAREKAARSSACLSTFVCELSAGARYVL